MMPFITKENPGSCFAFSCHVCSASFNLEQLPHLPWAFTSLTVLKIIVLQYTAFSKNGQNNISSPTCSSITFLLLSIMRWGLAPRPLNLSGIVNALTYRAWQKWCFMTSEARSWKGVDLDFAWFPISVSTAFSLFLSPHLPLESSHRAMSKPCQPWGKIKHECFCQQPQPRSQPTASQHQPPGSHVGEPTGLPALRLGASQWRPRHAGVEASQPFCAFSEFLTHRSHESSK